MINLLDLCKFCESCDDTCRVVLAFSGVMNKLKEAKNSLDVYKAIAAIEDYSLRDAEREGLYVFFAFEFPECFKLAIRSPEQDLTDILLKQRSDIISTRLPCGRKLQEPRDLEKCNQICGKRMKRICKKLERLWMKEGR